MAMKIETETVDRRDIFSSGSTKSRTRKICLEEYLHFIDTQNHSDISINYLNQIIAMHGYKKIHKTLKSTVSTAASSITAMNPRRSTLSEKISPIEAEASLESIFMDLNELGWQECSIASVEAIGAEIKRSVPASVSPPVQPSAPKKVRVRKPKEDTKHNQLALKLSDESEPKQMAPKPKPKPKKEAKQTASKPKVIAAKPTKELEAKPKPKRKRIGTPKRVALKPVENGVVSDKGNQSKRAATKRVSKKKCGCHGCANQSPCQFIW